MAKLRRAVKARVTSGHKPAKKRVQTARRPARAVKPSRLSASRKAAKPAPKAVAKPILKAAAKPVKAVKPLPPPPAPPQPPPAPVRKPTYHEAVAMYERGLQALQRRDFAASAEALRNVIQRYPDERELLERARLYLKVCERELEPKEPAPKTADEWAYAATVALNAGDEATTVRHLQRALTEDARHDHAHYMMAVVATRRGDAVAALDHLRQAVSANPENRSLARQDPELEGLRDEPSFKAIVDSPASDQARTAAPQRPRVKSRR